MIAGMKQQAARGMTVFEGRRLDMVAMPIGGIGTGCVSLGGWGQLRDWEIFGRPGKGTVNDMAFFTLHCRSGGESFTRVLQGPAGGPRMGPPGSLPFRDGASGHWGRSHGAGMPHFSGCTFTAHYPFADLSLSDAAFPLTASLAAWNPFIPLDDRDSSIPCAIFQWTFANPTRRAFDCTLFANLTNLVGHPETGGGVNEYRDDGRIRGIAFANARHPADSPLAGTMSLATAHRSVTWLNRWMRTGWFDALTDFWRQASTGRLDDSVRPEPAEPGRPDTSSLGLLFRLAPGASRTLPIVVAWHRPVQEMYWATPSPEGRLPRWKTHMATLWPDAWAAAADTLANLARLERETRRYDETLRSTTVPPFVLESLSATSSILKSPTCLRLPGGELWAWEGCHDRSGCCPGSCTHVWNYQQALPYLFPSLERGLRETEYENSLGPDGHMLFRMPLPLGEKGTHDSHAAADGQLGGVLKLYREWRISGDDAWIARLWPAAKASLEYAWRSWDRDRDGVMEGVQHNTYDIEFWGPNTLCGSFYLAALRAGERIARHLGDEASAERYRDLFEKGQVWTDANLWNGEYYEQRVNERAADGDPYRRPVAHEGAGVDGAGRPKYQYGGGCLADQLLGQLFADMLELGDLYDPDHLATAALSIFRYNWRNGFFDHANPQRIYAQDEESGLLLCTWPRGGRPAFPFPYSEEVWTGIEYTTAALLAYRGMVNEALAVVKAVRQRHDGSRRNPFDEFECGHHYARAMASWAVLLALAGFSADLPSRRLSFSPRLARERGREFATFFSVGTGWGLYRQRFAARGAARYELEVRGGSVLLETLGVSEPQGGFPPGAVVNARAGNREVAAALAATSRGCDVRLAPALELRPGATLVVEIGPARRKPAKGKASAEGARAGRGSQPR
jgi:non-lysosomal glucosylceramidase